MGILCRHSIVFRHDRGSARAACFPTTCFKKTKNLKLARCYLIFAAFHRVSGFHPAGGLCQPVPITKAVYLLAAAMFFLECSNADLWAIAMDLGGDHFSGTIFSGVMNTGQGVAGMISPIAFGFYC